MQERIVWHDGQLVKRFDTKVVVQFGCHPEQAFFAQRRTWASRVLRRAAFIEKDAPQ
jgi:hypothetical protein